MSATPFWPPAGGVSGRDGCWPGGRGGARWQPPLPGDPPHRPGRPGLPGLPPGMPGGPATPAERPDGAWSWLEQRLFEQETVALNGVLTGELASRASAALLTLEALVKPGTGRHVQLQVTSSAGDLNAAFALIDVLDVMKVPVRAVAIGQVGGPALAVYAAATQRAAYRHARFVLEEPRTDDIAGNTEEVLAAAGEHLRLVEEMAVRIGTATGHTQAEVERDLSARRRLSAAEAQEYGLVTELV